jgi:hypothetical protein
MGIRVEASPIEPTMMASPEAGVSASGPAGPAFWGADFFWQAERNKPASKTTPKMAALFFVISALNLI